MERTIAAIATPSGMGAIAVIRLSGIDAVEIADKVFKGGKKLTDVHTHTIHYGFIVDENGNKVDEVLVSVMLAPKTFTRENVVEISTHGGMVASKRVLEVLLRAGAYPAQAGEFTKRAFLNGRIDLSQAEAVIDVINAENDMSMRNAISQLGGTLSAKINNVRDKLVHLAASMQVLIDYPDEDLADVTTDDIRTVSCECKSEIQKILKTADSGKIIKDGVLTAIVGKPNVGKSSLLNALAAEERAIVTDIAGTTRDVIEEYVNLGGVPLRLMDTAGIRSTDDVVEKIGVEKSKKCIEQADLVIIMLDSTKDFEDIDKDLLSETEGKKRIVLINKSDIGNNDYSEYTKDCDVIKISAKSGEGLDRLAECIKNIYNIGELGKNDGGVITNMRHKTALIKAAGSLEKVVSALDMGMPSDIVSIDINEAIEVLGEIVGATVSEDIVDEIFHNFCVGK